MDIQDTRDFMIMIEKIISMTEQLSEKEAYERLAYDFYLSDNFKAAIDYLERPDTFIKFPDNKKMLLAYCYHYQGDDVQAKKYLNKLGFPLKEYTKIKNYFDVMDFPVFEEFTSKDFLMGIFIKIHIQNTNKQFKKHKYREPSTYVPIKLSVNNCIFKKSSAVTPPPAYQMGFELSKGFYVMPEDDASVIFEVNGRKTDFLKWLTVEHPKRS
jgi:hypothetical protein